MTTPTIRPIATPDDLFAIPAGKMAEMLVGLQAAEVVRGMTRELLDAIAADPRWPAYQQAIAQPLASCEIHARTQFLGRLLSQPATASTAPITNHP